MNQSQSVTDPSGFPVVGVVGGGQLARMMAPPAINLGLHLAVLSERDDDSAALVVPATSLGSHTDAEAVSAFAKTCDVLTFDHEHVPNALLRDLEAAGVAVHPGPQALVHAQDKAVMRQRMAELGIPQPRWALVRSVAELADFAESQNDDGAVGLPVVLKTPRGGYDGKGVRVVSDPADAQDWFDRLDGDAAASGECLLAEQAVDFRRELAVLIARSPSGQAAAWPVVETVQTEGICTEVLAPAPDLDGDLAARATEIGLRIAGELGVVGVLAVELFEVTDAQGRPQVLVNELAMRPHNSGHWTIDGAITSQFEQHLRAVLDLPLGDTSSRAPWTVMANVLGGARATLTDALAEVDDAGARIQLYGKGVRAGRKVGHVNVSAETREEAYRRAVAAAAVVRDGGRA